MVASPYNKFMEWLCRQTDFGIQFLCLVNILG